MTTDTGAIQNISGRDLVLGAAGGGRLVYADQAIDVPLDQVTGYTQQETTWLPYDEAAKVAHAEMLEVIAYLIALEAEPEGEAVSEPTAKELVKAIAGLDEDDLANLLLAELARSTPRKSVVEAAEKRAAELNQEN